MSPKLTRQNILPLYRWSVIALGSVIFFGAFYRFIANGFEWQFIVLAIFTALVAPQISVKLPRFNGTITVADTFIFISLLMWGAPAAILLAVAETVASTSKIAKRIQTYLFNASVSAITMWTTAAALQFFFGDPARLANDLIASRFALALCVMGLANYAVTLALTAAMQAFKMTWASWRTWASQYCLWSCITFFVAAAAAGLSVKFVGKYSLLSAFIVIPIVALIYFTYRSYLRNLDALQQSEARFRSSFDHGTVGMALVSPEGKWLQANQSLQDLLGKNEIELLDSYYQSSVCEADLMTLEAKIHDLLEGKFPAFQMETRFARADGEEIWVLLGASTARDAQNTVRHLIFQTQDIMLRKKAEEQLRHDASHDALTGLTNRAAYAALLAAALARSKTKNNSVLAILFLDLDGFKLVNDSLGHVAGDELLKATANRLLECVRSIDTVARLGGDEFTILLEDLNGIEQAVRVAERIKQKLAEPFFLAGQEIFIGTSIGIASTLIDYGEPGEMLRDADAAMYQAKARGKGCHVVFDHQMYANATKMLRLANDLRRATERGELVVNYQAIHSLESDEICCFEALMRWHHPHYGLLMPSEFIALAEENGLINQIDNWGLSEACRQMYEWQSQNPAHADLKISVNVSTKQFAQSGLVEHVKRVLRETGLAPHNLQLEITESAMVKSIKNTARILGELTALGVVIALDDFGTGYSSLSYLHELPISTLKVDRSFVNRLVDDEADGAEIVRAIVVLARNLKMQVVAEGIETREQLKQLTEMGCDYGQGFLFSRPVSVEEASKLLAKNQLTLAANRVAERRKGLRLVSGG